MRVVSVSDMLLLVSVACVYLLLAHKLDVASGASSNWCEASHVVAVVLILGCCYKLINYC